MNFPISTILEAARVADTPYIRNAIMKRAVEHADGDHVADLALEVRRFLERKAVSGNEIVAALEYVLSRVRAQMVLEALN